MEKKKLSILILTIPDRADKLQRLMDILRPQLPTDNSVELIIQEELPVSQGGPTIGANRNAALELAAGEYVAFVDDDDRVSEDYVEKVLKAIGMHGTSPFPPVAQSPEDYDLMSPTAIMTKNPDVVGIKGHYIVGDSKPQLFIHSMKYEGWFSKGDTHYRCPNHLNPVRRELALQVKFPERNHGEDYEYSKNLLRHLKTEVMIEDVIYFYLK